MKRAASVAVLLLSLTLAVPAAFAETQCQTAGSVEALLSSPPTGNPIQVDLDAPGDPMEMSHGGRIPHCGDRCDVEGAGGGCVYYGTGGQLVRTPATCRNGYWTPSP